MRNLVCMILLFAAAPALAQDKIPRTFLNKEFDDDVLRFRGPDPKKHFTQEKEGLRLRFAGNAPPSNNPASISWRFRARGNFSVTAKYEILNVAPPENMNYGAGAELYLMLDNATKEGISFGRLMGSNGVPFVAYSYMRTIDGKRKATDSVRNPTDERSLKGRFRLVREGTTLTAFFAEADDPEFKEIGRSQIGNADISLIRFAGISGGDTNAALDMRMLDFEIEGVDLAHESSKKFKTPAPKVDGPTPVNADAPPPKVDAPAPKIDAPTPIAPTPERTNLWIFAIIALVIFVPLLAILGVFLFLRLRKSKPAIKPTATKKPAAPAKDAGVKPGPPKARSPTPPEGPKSRGK